MSKGERYFFVLLFIAIPLIVYYYYLPYSTTTIYGDDLYQFKYISNARCFHDLIIANEGKYRPVQSFVTKLLFNACKKNLKCYYLFNISIQVINTYLIALLSYLFLHSRVKSLLISIVYGLNHFSFYVVSELFNGGALEGLAMTFFLLSVYCILFISVKIPSDQRKNSGFILLSIFFANCSMYTHERYVILFPFLICVFLFAPKSILFRYKKILYVTLSILSVIVNIFIKKIIYSIPFFVGTGGTTMSLSINNSISFLLDALLSIFQINSGPDYLAGKQFVSLQLVWKIALIVFAVFCMIVLLYYLAKSLKAQKRSKELFSFVALLLLFFLCLVPAVSTIRLEQRWLQASAAVFILLLVIAESSLLLNPSLNNILYMFTFGGLLCANMMYFRNGVDNLYLTHAKKIAGNFKASIKSGALNSYDNELFMLFKDPNGIKETKWAIGGGYFFIFYQNKSKQLFFIDSICHKTNNGYVTSFAEFRKNNSQILFLDNRGHCIDITGLYLRDSLKTFGNDIPANSQLVF